MFLVLNPKTLKESNINPKLLNYDINDQEIINDLPVISPKLDQTVERGKVTLSKHVIIL